MAILDFPNQPFSGDVAEYSFSFASRLASGETISSVTAAIGLWAYSPVADGNAANLVLGSPFIAGSTVWAFAGGLGTAGFKPGAVYTLMWAATTSAGQTLQGGGNITCQAVAPPTSTSGGIQPTTEINVTTNMTPTAPGYYWVKTTGVTITPPSGAVGGDIVIADDTGANNPNITIGATLNYPSGLTIASKGQAIRMRWSALNSGNFIL